MVLQVREYVDKEVEECTRTRAARGASTWFTFVGDSNMRQKLHSFLGFLPQELKYTYFLGKQQVKNKWISMCGRGASYL